MTPSHPAWDAKEPKWVPLAPGVSWLLRQPDGVDRQVVANAVGQAMSKVLQGRAALDAMGVDLEDPSAGTLDLERIKGFSSVMAAHEMALRCLQGWQGIDDPSTGQPLDHTDREAVRSALIDGPPPGGGPDLLAPFLSWMEGPKRPTAAESVRLRERARDFWNKGSERCRACADENEACALGGSVEGQMCPQIANAPLTYEGGLAWSIAMGAPGLWGRAGIGGQVTGLDYGSALAVFEARCGDDRVNADLGAAFAYFRAMETGVLEAVAEMAKTHQTAGEA